MRYCSCILQLCVSEWCLWLCLQLSLWGVWLAPEWRFLWTRVVPEVIPDSSPLFLGTRTIPGVLVQYTMGWLNLAGAYASLPNQPEKVVCTFMYFSLSVLMEVKLHKSPDVMTYQFLRAPISNEIQKAIAKECSLIAQYFGKTLTACKGETCKEGFSLLSTNSFVYINSFHILMSSVTLSMLEMCEIAFS